MNRYFTRPAAASTMTTSHLQERKLYVARTNLVGGYAVTLWSDDGTTGGTSLFSSSYCPLVQAVAVDPSQQALFTVTGKFGPMLKGEIPASQNAYMWVTLYDGTYSMWYTIAYAGGSGDGSDAQATNQTMMLYLYAMGR